MFYLIALLAVSLVAPATMPGLLHAQADTSAELGDRGGSLRPGDYVRIKIWREPDLSDTVQVDPDGIATFAKIGPVKATGLEPDSLRRTLAALYSRFLVNPAIEITLLRRISITGAVQKPGLYPVDNTLTIAEALALAGGAAQDGRLTEVQLRRGGEKIDVKLDGETRLADTPLRSGDQLYVPQKSWVERNTSVIFGVLGLATSIAFLVAD
jgi:polysaccharide biosynthesis/export protein